MSEKNEYILSYTMCSFNLQSFAQRPAVVEMREVRVYRIEN